MGLFVFQTIACFILLVCVGLAFFFKWTKPNGVRASLRTVTYLLSVLATFM